MKTLEKLLVLMILLFLGGNTFAQLYVDPIGHIGIGMVTNYPSPVYNCNIKGNLLLTTYPEIPPPLSNYVEFTFKVGNGWPGAEFGSNWQKVALYNSVAGYNDLYVQSLHSMSDSTNKTNIQPIENGLGKILQLNTYSFNFKNDTVVDSKLTYGFIAQQVQHILPDDIDTMKNSMLMDYQQIIPLTVRAIQQQVLTIDSLKAEVDSLELLLKQRPFNELKINNSTNELTLDDIIREINEIKNQLTVCCKSKEPQYLVTSKQELNSKLILYQNSPNPFSNNTQIEFEINMDYTSASIIIFDMQGTLLESIPINQTGRGQITIIGNELSAGMYLYSLVVDNEEIDTKRMILLR